MLHICPARVRPGLQLVSPICFGSKKRSSLIRKSPAGGASWSTDGVTGATGVVVVQAPSVTASISTQAADLSLILAVDLLCALDTRPLCLGDLFQCPDVLGITLRLVPLVQRQHPQRRRHGVCQHPHGQASGE
nr:MAG TPA: hypothetical protein [Caudoviricetes sp.]